MAKLFFAAILFFAVLGIFIFFLSKHPASRFAENNNQSLYMILTVKNNENSIEGILRTILWESQKNAHTMPKLIVLDLDSNDQTFSIVKKLSEKYPFIQPMKKTEYINFLSNL